MNYCPRCYHLTKEKTCHYCQSTKLRTVKNDDKCFLIERQLMWAETLKERLEQEHIPYQCTGHMGTGMTLKLVPI